MRLVRWVLGFFVLGTSAAVVALFTVEELRWRASLFVQKAGGAYPEASWAEFVTMILPGSGFYLDRLESSGSLYPLIKSPYRSEGDLAAGRNVFSNSCARCHGASGEGGVGPALRAPLSARTASDWAIYRSVRYGIPGTTMNAQELDWDESWQLTSYVRLLLTPESLRGTTLSPLLAELPTVSESSLVGAEQTPENWLTYGGNYAGHRFSGLTQLSPENIESLVVRWVYQPLTNSRRIESTPLVVNGVMFVTFPPSSVAALDARTGQELWRSLSRLPDDFPSGTGIYEVNRGVAVLDDKVFIATLDTKVRAHDARTGKIVWESTLGDYRKAVTFTSAPLAVNGTIVIGTAGGDFPTRGYIVGLDAATGKERWRFYTVPEPGQPGNETWEGDSWQVGGSAPWMTGTYDPDLNLVYWGVGNPAPDHTGEDREGDNLYSCSVVALDLETGELAWHFQFTPHDLHDWDATQVPVLSPPDGDVPKRMWFANRNGFFYVLDRETGAYISATPFVKQTWASSINETGRPVRLKSAEPTATGAIVYPHAEGGTNWWPPAYDPQAGLFFVPFVERGAVYYSSPGIEPEPAKLFLLGSTSGLADEKFYSGVRAIDPGDGRIVWSHDHAPRDRDAETSGLMTTAGGLVFGADQTMVFALNSRTGEKLWEFFAGDKIATAPISYAVGGNQFVAISAGGIVVGFGLPDEAQTRFESGSVDPAERDFAAR